MSQHFLITIDMKIAKAYVAYCKFYVGRSEAFSISLFETLHGVKLQEDPLPLRMVLESEKGGILQTRYCTLKELTENCRLITKEVFKHLAIDSPDH